MSEDWEARALAAEARLAAVGALCDEARAGLSIPPIDCTWSCGDGPCDCSGVFRVCAWDLDPDAVRRVIAEAQP